MRCPACSEMSVTSVLWWIHWKVFLSRSRTPSIFRFIFLCAIFSVFINLFLRNRLTLVAHIGGRYCGNLILNALFSLAYAAHPNCILLLLSANSMFLSKNIFCQGYTYVFINDLHHTVITQSDYRNLTLFLFYSH